MRIKPQFLRLGSLRSPHLISFDTKKNRPLFRIYFHQSYLSSIFCISSFCFWISSSIFFFFLDNVTHCTIETTPSIKSTGQNTMLVMQFRECINGLLKTKSNVFSSSLSISMPLYLSWNTMNIAQIILIAAYTLPIVKYVLRKFMKHKPPNYLFYYRGCSERETVL